MILSGYKVASASSFFIVFLYTYFMGLMFVGGDQAYYRLAYDMLSDFGFLEGYFFYKTVIITDEIGHFAATWLASQVFDKDIFNAFVNAIFAYFSVKVFARWGARPVVAFLLVVFGYYYIALYISAERLKYASVLFVIAVYYFPVSISARLLFLAAIVTHLQYVILIAVYFFDKFVKMVAHAFAATSIRVSDVFWLALGVASMLGCFVIFFDHIYSKFSAYHNGFELTEFLRILGFFALSLYYSDKKSQVFSVFFVLFCFVYLVGGMRVNIFGYFVFLYYSLRVNGGFNFGVITTFVYFCFRWVEYSYLVINCGVNRPC